MSSMIRWWSLALSLGAGCSFRGGGGGAPDDAAIDAPTDAVDAPPDVPAGSWWNVDWKRRNLVTIHLDQLDRTLTGYPLVGFPALVTLTPAVIDYAMVKPDGSDLRFILASDDTTPVPYEIDTWNHNGTSKIWVRIPTIALGTNPQAWLYHANTSATAASDGAAVFGAGYVSVHHLDDGPNDYSDATGHNHTGQTTTPGNDPGPTTGQIGEGRNFDGSDDYIVLDGETAYDFTTSLSVSAWIRVQNFTVNWQAIVCKGDLTWRLHRQDGTNFIGFGSRNGENSNGDVPVNTNAWRHVAIVYDGTAKQIYVDGVLDDSDNYNQSITTDNIAVAFGRNENPQTGGGVLRYWLGGIDEVRISQQPRSAAWIGAEHRMATNAQLVTVAADEIR